MRNYWIFCITEDNYLLGTKLNIIGISIHSERILKKANTGDYLTFYISREHRPNRYSKKIQEFRGWAEITSELFYEDDSIWKSEGSEKYPARMEIKFHDKTKKAKIRPLINELTFINNKTFWGFSFIRSVITIPETDWLFIMGSMK